MSIADEVPFDIPDSWEWVRLSCVNEMFTGNSINETEKKIKYTGLNDGRFYIGTKDVGFDQTINYDNGVRIPYDNLSFRIAPANSILLCVEGGSAGRKIAFTNQDVCFGNKLCCFISYGIDYLFLYYYLQCPLFQSAFKENTTGIIGGVSLNTLKEMFLPVPPLAEQKRIVSAIGSFIPLIREYDEKYAKLSELNGRFQELLKKSILQMAVQGKLVPQDPKDEPASVLLERVRAEKEKLIATGKIKRDKSESVIFRRDNSHYEKLGGVEQCIDDQIPFEIPYNWSWTRLKNIVNPVSARRVHQSDWKSDGVPFFRAREIAKLSENGFVNNELFISRELYEEYAKSGIPKAGDIMVTAVGTLGKAYIVKESDVFYYKDASVICLENYSRTNPEYLGFLFQTPFFENLVKQNSAGTTVGTITLISAREYPIPLPPLAEQKRIVDMIKHILPYCERL